MEPGIFFALVAALIWGVFLFSLKRYFVDIHEAVVVVLVNVFAVSIYLPYAALTLDPATIPNPASFALLDLGVIVITISFVALALLLFMRALHDGDVSYVAPINKIVPVFVLPIEVLLLGQHLTALQVTGVIVATIAVYVANYERGPLLDPLKRAAYSTPARLALLSAVLYAVSDVGKRVALQELALPLQLWVPMLQAGIAVVMLPVALRHWPTDGFPGRLPAFVGIGLVVAVGEHVTSLAFQVAPASIASPIVNMQAIVAVILGGILLDETALRTRLTAAVLAVLGVGLIAT